jgi:hypothetical protein
MRSHVKEKTWWSPQMIGEKKYRSCNGLYRVKLGARKVLTANAPGAK